MESLGAIEIVKQKNIALLDDFIKAGIYDKFTGHLSIEIFQIRVFPQEGFVEDDGDEIFRETFTAIYYELTMFQRVLLHGCSKSNRVKSIE